MATYRYSRWDGSQQVFDLDEDAVLDAVSDDILAHGDVERALRALFQRGLSDEEDGRLNGLRDLLDTLKQRRQDQLDRYNLNTILDDLKERLKDVVETERRGIAKRLQEARDQLEGAVRNQAEHLEGPMRLLEERAERSKQTLDALPDSLGGAVRELQDYDFIDPEARQKFKELLDVLEQQMAESMFQGMREQLQEMTPESTEALRDMLRALNQMLRVRAMGMAPDFAGFMEQYGHHFGPDRPTSLEELIEKMRRETAAMDSLMESMTPEMRQELQDLMESSLGQELIDELAELAARMQAEFPTRGTDRDYPFMGEDPVTLQQAMELMRQLRDMDQLEDSLRAGDVESIDAQEVERLLGEDARRDLEQLSDIVRMLEESGYVKRDGGRLELTPKAVRRIAQSALREVFSQLKKDRLGPHEVYVRGDGGERTGETKTYEYGDPFDIDLQRTVFNGVLRAGPRIPVHLSPEDLEINRTEHLTQTATVLLLDQSRSMGMFGNFAAAKKVALALYWLIHSQFGRDYFHVVGFSDYATEIKGEDLADITWNDWVSGTNMHHALMLSRKLLSKQKAATKQILMISDGEPTAHLEGGRSFFSYPPSYRTVVETLKEVERCTRLGITINTFMLANNRSFVDFVDRMTRINRGRAFYSTPGQLGRYIMVDYLRNRRKVVA